MNGLFSLLSGLAQGRGYLLLTIVAALVIGPAMAPVEWSGNEIVYFDQSWRMVRPDAFTDAFSMFDAEKARIAGMALIGGFIGLFGFEGAKTVLGLLTWGLYALALAGVARGLGLRAAELAVALLVFVLVGQELVGLEWMFGTVETKVLAYICVLFALAAGLRQRWTAAMVLTALGTLFHFLVGGAWALFLLLLHLMQAGRLRPALRLLALYTVLVLPVIAILVYERIGVHIDLSGLDRSPDQILGESMWFHVSPFVEGWKTFILLWVPGLVGHAALAVALLSMARSQAGSEPGSGMGGLRAVVLWAAVLNGLLLVVTVAAFADRNTHLLAKFLMFRPSSPVLLISCLLLARGLMRFQDDDRAIGPAVVILTLAMLFAGYLQALNPLVDRIPLGARLEAQMLPDERDILNWVRTNTPGDAAILVEPPAGRITAGKEEKAFPAGLERLSRRGFIVNYKNFPTDANDMVRWYRLIQERTAFFQGDCGRLSQLGADYVVFRYQASLDRLAACQSEVYRNGTFIVARTVSG